MTTMNLVQICQLKYPGQLEAGNMGFRQPEDTILFSFWKVPGIEQPLESDLMAEAPQWQPIYDFNVLQAACVAAIDSKLESTAKAKSYDSALSCASYASSTNATWKAESQAFIDWRDAVWNYAYLILDEVQRGVIPAPTVEAFIAGMPAMVWPT